MTTKPVLGISGCLTGSAVRFDGGHKRMGFVMDELAQWVSFRPVCPEMAIGLPTPRPAIRLTLTDSGETLFRIGRIEEGPKGCDVRGAAKLWGQAEGWTASHDA